MSYAPPRPRMTKAHRLRLFDAHKRICHYCRQPIAEGQPYDIDHIEPREMGGSDEDFNLAPIHRGACHKAKTRVDRRRIAASNHQARLVGRGPLQIDRPPKAEPKMRGRSSFSPGRSFQGGRGFAPGHRPIRSRGTFARRSQ